MNAVVLVDNQNVAAERAAHEAAGLRSAAT
jgi:hypothetical protein